MKHVAKVGLAALTIGVVVLGVCKGVSRRNRRQDIANALKLAGYEQDDAGGIMLTPGASGIALAYDPNLYDPTIGHRSCINRINTCFEATKQVERCMKEAPRFVSSTPWNNDPAGDDCCPQSCIDEYYERRKTMSAIAAFMEMGHGTYYPGMQEMLRGKKL